MTTVRIEKAGRELAALIERARGGEEIVISDGRGSRRKLSPLPPETSFRGRGALKEKISVDDKDLFDPLPDEEISRFWGGDAG
jgi:antitoxin (DNA-binding transcriptional repressor) of toxin-antitoxin stability system